MVNDSVFVNWNLKEALDIYAIDQEDPEESEVCAPCVLMNVEKDGNSLSRVLALAHCGDEEMHESIRTSIVDELEEYGAYYDGVLFGRAEVLSQESKDVDEWLPLSTLLAFSNKTKKGVVLHSRSEEHKSITNGPSRTFLPLRLTDWHIESLTYIHIAWSDDLKLDHFVLMTGHNLIVNDIFGLSRVDRLLQSRVEGELQDLPRFTYMAPEFNCPYSCDQFLDFLDPPEHEDEGGHNVLDIEVHADIPSGLLPKSTTLTNAIRLYSAHIQISNGSLGEGDTLQLIPNVSFMHIEEDETSLSNLYTAWATDSVEFLNRFDFSAFFPSILTPVDDTGVDNVVDDFPSATVMYEAYGKSMLLIIDAYARMNRKGLLPVNFSLRMENLAESRSVRNRNQDGSGTTSQKYAGYIIRYLKFCKFFKLPSCLVTEDRVLQFLKMEQQRPRIASNIQDNSASFVGKRDDGSLPNGINISQYSLAGAVTALSTLAKVQKCVFPDTIVSLYTPAIKGELKLFELRVQRLRRENKHDVHSHIYDEALSTDETCRKFVNYYLSNKKEADASRIRNAAQIRVQEALASRAKWTRMVKWPEAYFTEMGKEGIPTVGFFKVLTKGSTRGIAVGMARHKDVDLCPVAYLGMHIFMCLHKDYDKIFSPGSGFHNFSEWSDVNWFYATDVRSGISRRAQLSAHKRASDQLKINSKIRTHLWRNIGMHKMDDNGVDNASANRLAGNSSTLDVSQLFYKRKRLPQIAIKTQAGFKKDEPYLLARAVLEPPEVLIRAIFPFIEKELKIHEQLLKEVRDATGLGAMTVPGFLNLLAHVRLFLLQDSIVLKKLYPNLEIWGVFPFNTEEYLEYYSKAQTFLTSLTSDIIRELRKTQVDKKLIYAIDLLNQKTDRVLEVVQSNQRTLQKILHHRPAAIVSRRRKKPRVIEEASSQENVYDFTFDLGSQPIENIIDIYKQVKSQDEESGNAKWRSKFKSKWGRVATIQRSVQTHINAGLEENEAIAIIEAKRNGSSIDKLVTILRSEEKALREQVEEAINGSK